MVTSGCRQHGRVATKSSKLTNWATHWKNGLPLPVGAGVAAGAGVAVGGGATEGLGGGGDEAVGGFAGGSVQTPLVHTRSPLHWLS